MAKGVRRAPKINTKWSNFERLKSGSQYNLDKIKKLVALRDEVLKRYSEAKKASERNREVNIKWSQSYRIGAICVLEPLKKLADKCK